MNNINSQPWTMPSTTNFWRMTFSRETMKLGTILSNTSRTNWQSRSRKQKSNFSQKTRCSSRTTATATRHSVVSSPSYRRMSALNSAAQVVMASVMQQATRVSVVVTSLSCATVMLARRFRYCSTAGCTARRKVVMPKLSVRLKPVRQAVRLELAAASTCGAKRQGLPNMQFFCFLQQAEESISGPMYSDCPMSHRSEMYSWYRSGLYRTSAGLTWQQQRSMRAWPSTEVAGKYRRKQKPSFSNPCIRVICTKLLASMLSSARITTSRPAPIPTSALLACTRARLVSKMVFWRLLQLMFCSFCSLRRMMSMSRSISRRWVARRLADVCRQQALLRMCSFWKCCSRFFQYRSTRRTFSSEKSKTIYITCRPFRKQRATRSPTNTRITTKNTPSRHPTINWSTSIRERFSWKVSWKRILVALIMWSQEGMRYMLSIAKSQPVRLIGRRPSEVMQEMTSEQISTWSYTRPRLKLSLRKGPQRAGALSAGSKRVRSVRGSELKAMTFCVWAMIWLVTEAWLPTARKFFMQFLVSAMGKRQRLRKLRNCVMLASSVPVSRRVTSSSITSSPTSEPVSSRIARFASVISRMLALLRRFYSLMKMLFSGRRFPRFVVLKSRWIPRPLTDASLTASLSSLSGGRSGSLALRRQTKSSRCGSLTSTNSLKYLTAGTSSPSFVRKLVNRAAQSVSSAQAPVLSHCSTFSSCVHLNSSGISRWTGLPTTSSSEYSTKLGKERLTFRITSVSPTSRARRQNAFLSNSSDSAYSRSRESLGSRWAVSPRKKASSVTVAMERLSSASREQSRRFSRKKEQFMKMYRHRRWCRRYFPIRAQRSEVTRSNYSFSPICPRTSVRLIRSPPIAFQILISREMAASMPSVMASKVSSATIMCSNSMQPSKTVALKASLLSRRMCRSLASRSCSRYPAGLPRARTIRSQTSKQFPNSFSTNSQQSTISPTSPGDSAKARKYTRRNSARNSPSCEVARVATSVRLRQSCRVACVLTSRLSMLMMKCSLWRSEDASSISDHRKTSKRLA